LSKGRRQLIRFAYRLLRKKLTGKLRGYRSVLISVDLCQRLLSRA